VIIILQTRSTRDLVIELPAFVQRQYFGYSEDDFEYFCPKIFWGDALHRWGEIGRKGVDHQISPHRCRSGGVGPQNWNKRPTGISIFTKFWGYMGSFSLCHLLNS